MKIKPREIIKDVANIVGVALTAFALIAIFVAARNHATDPTPLINIGNSAVYSGVAGSVLLCIASTI
jgi:hypothetical protein